MKLYLAGPMTGLPEKNHPAFMAAAAALREAGHEVFNPAEFELDAESLDQWCSALCYDVGDCVCKAEGIAVLPGFHQSKGACLEVHTALSLKKTLVLIPGQNEEWLTTVHNYFAVSIEAMYRGVEHFRYKHD